MLEIQIFANMLFHSTHIQSFNKICTLNFKLSMSWSIYDTGL